MRRIQLALESQLSQFKASRDRTMRHSCVLVTSQVVLECRTCGTRVPSTYHSQNVEHNQKAGTGNMNSYHSNSLKKGLCTQFEMVSFPYLRQGEFCTDHFVFQDLLEGGSYHLFLNAMNVYGLCSHLSSQCQISQIHHLTVLIITLGSLALLRLDIRLGSSDILLEL